jgi:tetratricopeptide (TPR) repeat protein
LNVLSDNKISATLQLMTRPASTRLTPEIVREVCQRADGKAWIGGLISNIGIEYVVGLKAVNCQNGEVLAQNQVTAPSKEAVLDALGQAATTLRREVGESLASVQKFDVPLAQATTASLEALKADSLGTKALHEQGTNAAIPFFQHAVELDPDFADGYMGLGKMYANLGEFSRAEKFFTKAYFLRQRTSERERFDIESMYYMFVTGDLENCSRVFREWLGSYPRSPVAQGNLGNVYSFLGQPQQAAELDRESLQQTPDDVIGYMNLARALMESNRFLESRKTIQDAFDRKLDAEQLHNNLYLLAFFANDARGLAEQVAWSEGRPEATQDFLSLQSSVEAYSGHLHKARDLSRWAVEAAERADNKEAASSERMREALSEAAFGNLPEAKHAAVSALNQPGAGYNTQASSALVFAWVADAARSQSILDKLDKRFPQGTLVQSVVLPTVRARMELARNNPERAIELLQASVPYELTDVSFNACLYPAYVRGEAQIATQHGLEAALEFQKILDHRGLVGPCETAALAHLGLGRAYAIAGDSAKAKAAYQDFLTLWKDADPNTPILKQAKAEYSRLQ